MYLKPLRGTSKKLWASILFVVVSLLAANALFFSKFLSSRETQRLTTSSDISNEAAITTVTALGRLEPEGAPVRLSASSGSQRLSKVLVEEGDQVQVGQIIAIGDSLEARRASLNEADAKLKSAQARLITVQAGRNVGDISAQQNRVTISEAQWVGDITTQESTIARLAAELSNAEADYQRYQNLYEEGAISAAEFDLKKVAMESLQEQLAGAEATLERVTLAGEAQIQAEKNTLKSISDVRSVDIAEAEAKVAEAIALYDKAKVDVELAYVRSPIDGQILALNAQAGETVGGGGIAEIGKTQQMYAVAEVYETDIRHIQVGQSATLRSEYGGFLGELKGTVEKIGLQIGRPGTVNRNPSAVSDVRVVEVKIRLNPEDSEQVKHLNKLQVRASIQI